MNNWISVNDEFPPKGKQVIGYGYCYNPQGWSKRSDLLSADYAKYEKSAYSIRDGVYDGISFQAGILCGYELTHWMPLPEPPE